MPLTPKKIIERWAQNILDRFKISANELARKSGLAGATIHRMLGRDASYHDTPSMKSVRKVAEAMKVAPPDIIHGTETHHSGFAENDAIQILSTDTPDVIHKLTSDQSVWQVIGNVMQLAGYCDGDHFVLDASISPCEGDAVIAQVYDLRTGSAETVLRIFQGTFLLAASAIGPNSKPIYIDGERIRVAGVIVSSWRERISA